MLSKTSRSVCSRPCSTCTISSRCRFIARLMKRSRCFWFMQEEAWMCVSTWGETGLLSPPGWEGGAPGRWAGSGLSKLGAGWGPRPPGAGWPEVQGQPRVRTHLADVVEISVWHLLLGGQLLHLVEQHVHLELGAQVLQPAVAERLSGRRRKKQGLRACGGALRSPGSRAEEAAREYRAEAANRAADRRNV